MNGFAVSVRCESAVPFASVTWMFQVSVPRAGGAGADWVSVSFIVFACGWMVTGGEYVSTRGSLWQLTTSPLSALPPFEPPHAQKPMARSEEGPGGKETTSWV